MLELRLALLVDFPVHLPNGFLCFVFHGARKSRKESDSKKKGIFSTASDIIEIFDSELMEISPPTKFPFFLPFFDFFF